MPFVYDYNQYISGVLIGRIIFPFFGFINFLLIKAPAVAVVSSAQVGEGKGTKEGEKEEGNGQRRKS